MRLALSYLLNDPADRVIIVRSVELWRVHSIDGCAEASGVIVHYANEFQVRQIAILLELVEFPLPFVDAIEIRKRIIEAAKEHVGYRPQNAFRRGRHRRIRCKGIAYRVGNAADVHWDSIRSQVNEETIVPHMQACTHHRIPPIAPPHASSPPLCSRHVPPSHHPLLL